jgi:hypothetical protein
MPEDKYQTAYDKHWSRLAALLGIDEAAAERARMTADERRDRLRIRVEKFKKQLPGFRESVEKADRERNVIKAAKIRAWIAYREKVIAAYEEEIHADRS